LLKAGLGLRRIVSGTPYLALSFSLSYTSILHDSHLVYAIVEIWVIVIFLGFVIEKPFVLQDLEAIIELAVG